MIRIGYWKIMKVNETELKSTGFKQYKKIAPVWAKQVSTPFTCDTLEGDNISGKAGDFLCVGINGEMWPVDQEIFKTTYEEV